MAGESLISVWRHKQSSGLTMTHRILGAASGFEAAQLRVALSAAKLLDGSRGWAIQGREFFPLPFDPVAPWVMFMPSRTLRLKQHASGGQFAVT